ncbi:MAG: 6-carboxytetrahydropterin synthase [Deltaproteobacteria bacterium]|nr:MAG: 6-carboxytetrahydropterin synthase [Deltaproteobacteria bacterium]
MYELAVVRDFIAQHFLVGGDFGRENERHSHHYRVELRLRGRRLDAHGFLVDIDAVKEALERTVRRYEERTLNDLPEFEGLNPSLEHFVRLFTERLLESFDPEGLDGLQVRLWEAPDAWAAYTPPSR